MPLTKIVFFKVPICHFYVLFHSAYNVAKNIYIAVIVLEPAEPTHEIPLRHQ